MYTCTNREGDMNQRPSNDDDGDDDDDDDGDDDDHYSILTTRPHF